MKYTLEDIRMQFEERGYKLLSKEYINQKQRMEFICPKHEDKGTQTVQYTNFRNKNCGCHFCAKEKMLNRLRTPIDEIKRITEIKGLEFVDVTYGADNKRNVAIIDFICPRHRDIGIQQTTLPTMKKKQYGCNYCNFMLDTQSFLKKLHDKNIEVDVVGDFKGLNEKMEFVCPIHKTHYRQLPRKTLEYINGCPNCRLEFLSTFQLLSKEEAEEKLQNKFPSLHIISDYTNTFTKTKLYCDLHNCYFDGAINNYLYKGKVACCPCGSAFKGEKYISEYLLKNGYQYEAQKSFEDLRGVNGGKLSFDFYITNHNICVEFNGEQHYMPINIFGGEQRFSKQQIHDKLKQEYCERNNIELIIVPYWEKENIENFLRERLTAIINK